jgi:hypothetical protein
MKEIMSKEKISRTVLKKNLPLIWRLFDRRRVPYLNKTYIIMKKITLQLFSIALAVNGYSQIQIDKSIQFTGTGSDAKISGIDQVTGAKDAVSAEAEQNNSVTYATATNSGNDYSVSLVPAPTYTAGLMVHFKASAANTGAVQLNVNGLGLKAITKNFNSPLAANDIKNGQLVTVMYDGTNFQMLSQLGQAGSSGLSFQSAKRIFVTSTSYNGNLGGIAGADTKCTTRAAAASLTGTWKALISDYSTDARNRSSHQELILNMAGEVVAIGYKDLFMSWPNIDSPTILQNSVGFNEFGAAVNGTNWWNGNDESGRSNSYSNCDNWTHGGGSFGGHMGETSRMSTGFYGGNGNNFNCNNMMRIICFQE